MYKMIKFLNQKRYPIYILVNRSLMYMEELLKYYFIKHLTVFFAGEMGRATDSKGVHIIITERGDELIQ